MKKVTGIGGIFFKSQDPKGMREWYEKHLGLENSEYGTNFDWQREDGSKGSTVWSPFAASTKYFEPSKREFMINYIVDDLEALVAELRAGGVTIVDDIVTEEYGKFVHILDPEGNKIELWEIGG